jgi:purine-nucleoside phosphorylase
MIANMGSLFDNIQETVAHVKSRTAFTPDVGIILGSGLGPLADEIDVVARFPYAELPHFPLSTAPGHEGVLILGTLAERRIVGYKGRVHLYEGYTAQQLAFPMRVGFGLGARTFLVTSVVGGLNPQFSPGDIVLHHDYINMAGVNPLTGPNDERLGPRFPIMFDAYDPELRRVAAQVARSLDIALRDGVYAWFAGPAFASRAELRVLRGLGADVIGMSTVPEVIALRHLGAKVLGLSIITDMAIPDHDHHATEQEVLEVAARSGEQFRRLVRGILAAI